MSNTQSYTVVLRPSFHWCPFYVTMLLFCFNFKPKLVVYIQAYRNSKFILKYVKVTDLSWALQASSKLRTSNITTHFSTVYH